MLRRGLVGLLTSTLVLAVAGAPIPSAAASAPRPQSASVDSGAAGTYVSLTPSRLLSTPSGLGGSRPDAAGTVHLQVGGRGGVPSSGVSAVVLNLTAYHPTTTGYVTAFADGATRPSVSSLNFAAGPSQGNLTVVPLSTAGKVALYNGSTAATDLIADVAGYYRGGTPSVAGAFTSSAPTRLLSTPSGLGGSKASGGSTLQLQVGGRGGVPSFGVSAVVLNLTAYRPRATGYVTAYAAGAARPSSSSLNFAAGPSRGNLAVVPLSAAGKVALFNGSRTATDLIADLAGYYRDGSVHNPGAFVPVPPGRILSTPSGTGGATPAGRSAIPVQAEGEKGLPSGGVAAVVVNLTAYHPAATGYFTAYADGSPRPSVSSLNFADGPSHGNLAVVPVGADGRISLYNGATVPVDVVADVAGYFTADTASTGWSTPRLVDPPRGDLSDISCPGVGHCLCGRPPRRGSLSGRDGLESRLARPVDQCEPGQLPDGHQVLRAQQGEWRRRSGDRLVLDRAGSSVRCRQPSDGAQLSGQRLVCRIQ